MTNNNLSLNSSNNEQSGNLNNGCSENLNSQQVGNQNNTGSQ